MMGKAHLAVLERGAAAAGGYYGDLLRRQRYWIERGAAGRFNDGVLRDWYYKKTPQTIWCVRRLTHAILDTPPDDESRIAFLLHWVSHYFVDAIWTCHVAQRYMASASPAEKKAFDNGIEREVEEIVATSPAFAAPPAGGRGYWTWFWQGRLESDGRSYALIDAWHHGAGYIPIALESVPYCTAAFAAYLTALNHRRERAARGDDSAADVPAAADADEWVVALNRALENGEPLADEAPAPPAGWQTDLWLDETGAQFGTGEPQLGAWPGEWVLAKSLSGQDLQEQVFTQEFADALTVVRGYARAEVEQEPEKAAPHAIADRDRQLALMTAWLERWDCAVGKEAGHNGANAQ